MKLSEMLRQHLEWLDDEDGTMPFPEFEGETGWVSHDDGSTEDWGQYLLRLSLDEVTQLEEENDGLRKLAHDYITAYEKLAFGDTLLVDE